jgi:hypothetical protein
VLLGAVLRILWPEGFLFRQDEAEHLADSFAVSQEGERPSHAWDSSAGLPNGPGYLYFLALVTTFTTDPRAAQGVITLLNVAALAMAVPLLRRWLPSPRDAEAAVALFATSPVAIWFSRKIWDPCLLPVLAVPALLLATRALAAPRSRAPALLLPVPLLAAIVQVHQSALFFALPLAVAVAPALRHAPRLPLALGAAAGAAVIAPYARFLLQAASRGELAVRTRSAWPDVDVLTNLLLDATGHNILQTAGFGAGGLLRWPVPPSGLLVQLAALPFAVTFALGFAELARPRTDALAPAARSLVRALGFGMPALLLVAHAQGAAHHYLAIWPVLFAVMVLGARRAAAASSRMLRRLPPPAALAALGTASWLLFQSYVSVHKGSASYGLPYADLVTASQDVRNAAAAAGLGTPEAPLRLAVEVARDRGPLPHQYRYVLERRLGVTVRAPGAGESPDLVLRVRWGDDGPVVLGPVPTGSWEIRSGP